MTTDKSSSRNLSGATAAFDERRARKLDRTLAAAAIAKIVAMPDDEFSRFRVLFDTVFWHPDRGYMIHPRNKARGGEA